jgi:RecB family exonuclease
MTQDEKFQEERPQITMSMINTAIGCGIQFVRRYGARFDLWEREEIIPPGIALITGISVHKAAELSYRRYIDTKGEEVPTVEEVQDYARDQVNQSLSNQELRLDEDEVTDIKQTFADAVDQTVALAGCHRERVVPTVKPISVERPFVVTLKNTPFDLSGRIDMIDAGVNDGGVIVRDLKTAKSAPQSALTMQNACYAVGVKICDGEYPESVALDVLLKRKEPDYKMVCNPVTESTVVPFIRRVERFVELIETAKTGHQVFLPANPDGPDGWRCTKKFCGYSTTCPFWSGK